MSQPGWNRDIEVANRSQREFGAALPAPLILLVGQVLDVRDRHSLIFRTFLCYLGVSWWDRRHTPGPGKGRYSYHPAAFITVLLLSP